MTMTWSGMGNMKWKGDFTAKHLETKLQKCLQIIRKYDWLIDANVLDFYVDDHWSRLSASWRAHLEHLQPEYLSYLLDKEDTNPRTVWPLSLLTLKHVLNDLNICRRAVNEDSLPSSALLQHPKLKHVFNKCVKPKKRHEIERMAAICKRSTDRTRVDFVVDFGAGLGHLARVLGYAYGIRVCCLEMQPTLNEQASVIDARLESNAAKYLSTEQCLSFQRPTHVTLCLSAKMQPLEFLHNIRTAMQLPPDADFSFGIIGLHPCGDLGAILMKMYLACAQAKYLNFVGCCYMKLSTCLAPTAGYPLSSALRQRTDAHLSYESREIACHALETYCERLRSGNYVDLKVHSLRAAAECVLVKHWPALRHSGLRSVKHTQGMTFEDYFYKAVQSLPAAALSVDALQTPATITDLLHWQRIVIFYTLRLMLAPLVESVILYDRILFLEENLCDVYIDAIFDPHLSPRNHITSATKRCSTI